MKEEKCECCGFEERRITDYTIPLLLTPIDGDKTNYNLDNLQVVCYNCFYLTVGNLFGKGSKIKFTRKKDIRDQILNIQNIQTSLFQISNIQSVVVLEIKNNS